MDLKEILGSKLTINSKQQAIRAFVDSRSRIDEKKLIESLTTVSDRYLLAEDLLLSNSGVIDRIKANYRFNRLQDAVHKQVNDIITNLESRERNGLTFEDVAYPVLAHVILSKEPVIFRELRSYVKNKPLRSLELKREFLLAAVETAILVLNYSHEPGLHTIKELVKERRFSGSLHSRSLIGYCDHIDFLSPFKGYISSMFQEESEQSVSISQVKTSDEQLHFYAMRTAKNWSDFAMHAEQLLDSSEDYKDLVTSEFTLLMNQPLLNIFKLLRFPGNRTVFTNWIKASPIPPRDQESLFKKIHTFSKHQFRSQQLSNRPQNNKELFSLFYNFTIDATYKYKLISTIKADDDVSQELQSLCLSLLKDRQYKVERQYITSLLQLLQNPKRSDDLINDLEAFFFSIRKHVGKYKIVLRKKINSMHTGFDPRIKKSFAVLFELIKNEKALSPELLQELYTAITQAKNPEGLIRLAHFISAYYITLNAQYICTSMKHYIASMSANDNLYITKLLSHETKESIYESLGNKDYSATKDIIHKFIKRGERERLLRIDTIRDLIVKNEELNQMRIGQHELEVLKYGNSFTIRIYNDSSQLRFNKTENNINNYFDFESFCKRYNIQTLVHIRPRQLKLMYQQAHVNLLNELLEYLDIYSRIYSEEQDYVKMPVQEFRNGLNIQNKQNYLEKIEFILQAYTALLNTTTNPLADENENPDTGMYNKRTERMQLENREARHAIGQLERLLSAINATQLDHNADTLARIDSWASRPVDMQENKPAPELPKIVIEDIQHNFSSVTNDRVQVSFLNSTAAENQILFTELTKAISRNKAISSYADHCRELEKITSTIQTIRCLEIDSPILENRDPNTRYEELIAENISNKDIQDTLKQVEHELIVRRDYLDFCVNRTDLATSILIYGKEITLQEKALKALAQFQSKLELELAKSR